MSRPKAWNGSAWVDPGFWTGSEYKFYIPPAYDVPANGADFQFASTVEGWTMHYNAGSQPADWVGGTARGSVQPGLLGYVYLRNPGGPTGTLDGPRQVFARARVRVESQPGTTDPNPIECAVRLKQSWNNDGVVDWNHTPGTDSGYVIRQTNVVTLHGSNTTSFEIEADAGALGGYGWCNLYVDYAQLIDNATGQVLQQLGDPGWQPYVYDGQRWI